MPLLKESPAIEPRKAVTFRMQESVVATLHQYAEFLGSSLEYVVTEALKLVFEKDTQFKKWLNENRLNPIAGQQAAEQARVEATTADSVQSKC